MLGTFMPMEDDWLYGINVNDLWGSFWDNLEDMLKLELIEALESPEQRRIRLLEEQQAGLEAARKAAWYNIVPTVVAIGIATFIAIKVVK